MTSAIDIENAIPESEFPEGKIVLLDKREVMCFPKEEEKGDEANLDKDWEWQQEKLFIKHAFLFYNNAEAILSDSRLFLAPVPIHNGTSLTGDAPDPTLGVFVEWWLHSGQAYCQTDDGEEWLTCRFAGSTLSGANQCIEVNSKGETRGVAHNPFFKTWRSFSGINERYTQAKQLYRHYPLEEVIRMLERRV